MAEGRNITFRELCYFGLPLLPYASPLQKKTRADGTLERAPVQYWSLLTALL